MASRTEIAAVRQTFERGLEGFYLHRTGHWLSVTPVAGGYSVGYASRVYFDEPPIAQFDANVLNGVFYLLFIQIGGRHRGRGFGWDLYERLEEIAHRLRCRELRMTPSGVTPRGETRRDWLLRRGYCCDGAEVYKELDCDA